MEVFPFCDLIEIEIEIENRDKREFMIEAQDHCISEQISFLRTEIDHIDDAVVKLLVERNRVVKKIHQLKRSKGLQIVDKDREAKIVFRLQALSTELNPNMIAEIYEAIFRRPQPQT